MSRLENANHANGRILPECILVCHHSCVLRAKLIQTISAQLDCMACVHDRTEHAANKMHTARHDANLARLLLFGADHNICGMTRFLYWEFVGLRHHFITSARESPGPKGLAPLNKTINRPNPLFIAVQFTKHTLYTKQFGGGHVHEIQAETANWLKLRN